MGTNYIPTNDSVYADWADNFRAYAEANMITLGLVSADIAPITSTLSAFTDSLTDHVAAQASAKSATDSKDAARADSEAAVRTLVKKIVADPDLTDAQREGLGITVPAPRTPVTAPTTRPVGQVEINDRFRHVIKLIDEGTGTKARPRGVTAAEIYRKVGTTAPTGPGDCVCVGICPTTPHVEEYDDADGNKTAYYMFRWVNTRGEKGPWSETVAATIAA